jgi:uncharacterized protein YukE
MTAYEFKQQVIIEQKNDKIEALIEGYKEIMRQLNHNQKFAKTDAESTAYYTARNIVEETMIEIADINVTDI